MVFARRSRPAALAQVPAVRVAQLAAAISYSKKKAREWKHTEILY